MSDEHTNQELQVLSDRECIALLSAHHFGRLGFVEGDWLSILPVSYVFEEPTIVVRTGPGTKLTESPLTIVAFEVDAADPDGTWGWSVLAQGPAFDITDSVDEYSGALRRLPVQPIAPGYKANWLKVTAVRLSGRRFGSPPAHA